MMSECQTVYILLPMQEVKRGPGTLIRRNSVTPLTSPESNIKKPRIDDLDEAPIHELPSVSSLALCSPSHLPLALAGQVRQLKHYGAFRFNAQEADINFFFFV